MWEVARQIANAIDAHFATLAGNIDLAGYQTRPDRRRAAAVPVG